MRDNGGGSDNSYNKLLPLLYTNPIQTVGVKFLSTELNNQRFLDFAASKEFNFLVRQVFKNYHKKLQRNLGEFVNLQKDTVITYKRNKVYQYPQNVGIIINQGCGSTTEQFLLAARQSTKVRLLGTNTWGCLDISNMYEVASPCKEFELGYGLSRTMRIPDMAIDEIGIEPDYYIDETIPQHKWVEYVNDILKQRKKAE